MDDFLSEPWVRSLDDALRGIEASGPPTTVEVHVATPDGESVHHLRLGPGPVRAVAGPAEAPGVVVRLDDATARAISRGELAPRTALADGRLSLSGDPGALTDHLAALGQPTPGAASPTAGATPAPR